MTTTTIIAALALLLATAVIVAAYLWLCVCVWRERAENLESIYVELRCVHDDAMRTLDRYSTSLDHHIAETTTLAWDLMRTEQEATYYRSLHMRRKGDVLGVLFASGLVRPQRHMRVLTMEQVP